MLAQSLSTGVCFEPGAVPVDHHVGLVYVLQNSACIVLTRMTRYRLYVQFCGDEDTTIPASNSN